MAKDGYWDDDHFSVAFPQHKCLNAELTHLSRRCQREEHDTCQGSWTSYPVSMGSCLCSCHGPREDDCNQDNG